MNVKRLYFALAFFLFVCSTIFASSIDDDLISTWEVFSSKYTSTSFEHFDQIEQSLMDFQKALIAYKNSDIYKYADLQNTNDIAYVDRLIFLVDELTNKNLDKAVFDEQFILLNQSMSSYLIKTNFSTKTSSYIFAEVLILLTFICLCVIIVSILYFRKIKESSILREENERSALITNTIISVQENERDRISHDLHDSVTQDIRTVLLYTRELEQYVPQEEDAQNCLSKIKLLEERNLKNIRSIIRNLVLPELDAVDFTKIINEYCDECTKSSHIPCSFFASGDVLLNKLATNQKLNIFRIIQESVHNAIKHASPTEISVVIRENLEDKKIIVFITDDGCGIDVSKQSDDGVHIGLKGMKSRSEVLNAKFEIITDKESGTEIRLEVPVE